MKVGVSIEHDEEQITNENINTIRLPNETSMDIPSFPASHARDSTAISRPKKSDHEELPSSLSIVGNAQKYSIIQTKAKDRQIAKSTKRSIFQSQREYGEVYVRHRVNFLRFNIRLKLFSIIYSLLMLTFQYQIKMKKNFVPKSKENNVWLNLKKQEKVILLFTDK